MITRVARPYAKALLDTTPDLAAARGLCDELARMVGAQRAVPRLTGMASHPGITLAGKQRVLAEVVQVLGLSAPAATFFGLLLRNYRFGHLPEITEAFDELVSRREGIVKATVRSASEPDAAQREHLQAVLSKRLGREVRLDVEVDPALLGGFVARVGSLKFDGSLRGQLQRLSERLVKSA